MLYKITRKLDRYDCMNNTPLFFPCLFQKRESENNAVRRDAHLAENRRQMAERALPLLWITGSTSVQVAPLRIRDPLRDVLPVRAPLGTSSRSDVVAAALPSLSTSRGSRRSVSERSCCGRPMNNFVECFFSSACRGHIMSFSVSFLRRCVRSCDDEGGGMHRRGSSVASVSFSCTSFWCCFVYVSELLVLLLLLPPSLRRFPFGSTIVSLSSSAIVIIMTRPTTTASDVAGRLFLDLRPVRSSIGPVHRFLFTCRDRVRSGFTHVDRD